MSTTPTIRQTLAITAIGAGQRLSTAGAVSQNCALEVVIETSPTGADVDVGDWYQLYTTTLYGISSVRIPPLDADAFVRARYRARSAVADTSASITFALTGTAD